MDIVVKPNLLVRVPPRSLLPRHHSLKSKASINTSALSTHIPYASRFEVMLRFDKHVCSIFILVSTQQDRSELKAACPRLSSGLT